MHSSTAESARPRTMEDALASDREAVGPLLGTYFSNELGLAYKLIYEDGRLWANSVRTGPILLLPIEGDTYIADGLLGRILFRRDDGGAITGFTMTGFTTTNSREVLRWTFTKAS